jgi:selenide,water dikinase
MVVTGVVHPGKVITNAGAKPGDALILTKPIGTGIIATAVKRGLTGEKTAHAARDIMAQLNAAAAKLMDGFPVNSCTDITGFGLLGHLKEMVEASKVTAEIYANEVPQIPGAYELAAAGAIPGGTKNNMDFVSQVVTWGKDVPELMKIMLCDAQTSGGLLVSLPEAHAGRFIQKLWQEHQINGVKIGRILEGKKPGISVV